MSRDTLMLATANQSSTLELPHVKPPPLHDTTSSVPVPGSFQTNTLGTKAGTVMSLFSSETANCIPDELRHNMIYTRIRTLVRCDISEGSLWCNHWRVRKSFSSYLVFLLYLSQRRFSVSSLLSIS